MEYTERRNQLLLPHEQLRLINEIPEVIPEVRAEVGAEDMKLGNESRKLMSDASSEDSISREATGDDSDKEAVSSSVSAGNGDLRTFKMKEQTHEIKRGDASDKEAVDPSISAGNEDLRTFKVKDLTRESKGGDASENGAVIPDSALNEDLRKLKAREPIQENIEGFSGAIETIDLSSDDDDDDDDERKKLKSTKDTAKERESTEWYCMGPIGDVRGPYQLSLLQKWKELSSNYASKFKVWRKDQSSENGIPLPDACRLNRAN